MMQTPREYTCIITEVHGDIGQLQSTQVGSSYLHHLKNFYFTFLGNVLTFRTLEVHFNEVHASIGNDYFYL